MSKEFINQHHSCPQQSVQTKSKIYKLIVPIYFLLLTISLVTVPIFNNIAPVQAQKSTSSLVEQGNRLLKKGWVNDAIQVFRQAIKTNPQSVKANLGLAIAYNRAGKIDAAWNSYQRVLELDPNYQPALKTVGLLGTYRPEWQAKGIAALTTLLNSSPNDLEARSLRAVLYYYQGRINDSVADYQVLLTKNPTPEILVKAAETFAYAGNYQQALELFKRYGSTGKGITGNAAIAYGRTLQKTGNPTEAIQVLKAQLARSNSLDLLAITTRAELSQAYIANNQQAEALAVLQPLHGKPDARLLLARSLNEIRKTETKNDSVLVKEVASLYRQVLADNPNPPTSLMLEVADVFSGLPQQEQTALQLYQQAAAKLPNDKSLVLRQLALQNKLDLISQKDLKSRLISLLQNLPQDPGELHNFANALVQINTRDSELIPSYQSVLQKGVEAPFLNFRIAQMYLRQKDTASARQALAAYQATPEGANNLATQLLTAEIELQEGNLEAGALIYQNVLDKKPDDEIYNGALRALAGIRSQQKRFDEALAAYGQLRTRQPQNLTYQLGQVSVAYQAKRIDQQQATTVVNNWLATQKVTSTPPELYSLVGQLPAVAEWEPLYNYLLQGDTNLQIQKRLLQVVNKRDPAQARDLVKQLATNPREQGELSKAIGDLDLAGIAYEKILTNQANDIDALTALGGIRFEQRRYEVAQKIYSQILTQQPQDRTAKMAIADLYAILDRPLAALSQMEQLQNQKNQEGVIDKKLSRRMQQIHEDFLLRRGFQPYWEDPNRRIRD